MPILFILFLILLFIIAITLLFTVLKFVAFIIFWVIVIVLLVNIILLFGKNRKQRSIKQEFTKYKSAKKFDDEIVVEDYKEVEDDK